MPPKKGDSRTERPKELYFMYSFGWTAGAAGRAQDPAKDGHPVRALREAYAKGYADGRRTRREATFAAAERYGASVSILRAT